MIINAINKKYRLSIIIVILVSIIITTITIRIIIYGKYAFSFVLCRHKIVTNKGDVFWDTSTFNPGLLWNYFGRHVDLVQDNKYKSVFFASGKTFEGYYKNKKKCRKYNMNCIYDTDKLRCYEFMPNTVICMFKETDDIFLIDYAYFGVEDSDLYFNYDKYLLPFAYNKFKSGELLFIKRFGRYLFKNEYLDSKKDIINYSKGKFTNNEVKVNSLIKGSLKEIQDFSRNLLIEDKILLEKCSGENEENDDYFLEKYSRNVEKRLPFAYKRFKTGKLIHFLMHGRYLYKKNYKDSRSIILRYVKGNFNSFEIQQNDKSDLAIMKECARELVENENVNQ